MSTLVEVSIIIVAAFVVLFILVLIPVLLKIGKLAVEVAKLAEMARFHIPPIAHDAAIIFSKAKGISESVNRQVVQIEGTVKKFKTYESIFTTKIARPFIDLIALLAGLAKGLSTFLNHIKK